MDWKRPRGKYTYVHCGLIGFRNPASSSLWSIPDTKNPVKAVNFCVLDTMFHVLVNFSPFEKDECHQKLGQRLRESNRKVNNGSPFLEGGANIISVWYPGGPRGCFDLEDMAQIVEGVPELQAGWLRVELNNLKYQAGLTPEESPRLDGHSNWNGRKRGVFQHSWFSAKGGTLYFEDTVTQADLEAVQSAFKDAEATAEIAEPCYPVWRAGSQSARSTLRFSWGTAAEDIETSRASMLKILDRVPGIVEPPGFVSKARSFSIPGIP